MLFPQPCPINQHLKHGGKAKMNTEPHSGKTKLQFSGLLQSILSYILTQFSVAAGIPTATLLETFREILF